MTDSLKRKISGAATRPHQPVASSSFASSSSAAAARTRGPAQHPESDSDQDESRASAVRRKRIAVDPLAGRAGKKTKQGKSAQAHMVSSKMAQKPSLQAERDDGSEGDEVAAAPAAHPTPPNHTRSPLKTSISKPSQPPSTPPRHTRLDAASGSSASPGTPGTPATPGAPDLTGLSQEERRRIKNKRKNDKKKERKRLASLGMQA